MSAAHVEARDIDLIITVSCTGIMIPSLDAHLVNELGFRADVRRLPITELGCVGGAAALARAHDFLIGFPEARALVISVELPSLSLQRLDVSPANLVATALFGDGAAAVVLNGGAAGGTGRRVRILETLAHIFPESTWALGFDLEDDGFHSVISKEVPALLKSEIGRLVRTIADRRGLSRDQLPASCCTRAAARSWRSPKKSWDWRAPTPSPRGTCCATTAISPARRSCSCCTSG